MRLKLLSFLIMTGSLWVSTTQAQVATTCPESSVNYARNKDILIGQSGLLTTTLKPYENDNFVGGNGILQLGLGEHRQIEFKISAEAKRGTFRQKSVRENLRFTNFLCHQAQDFAGTYTWSEAEKRWINSAGIAVEILQPDDSGLYSKTSFDVTLETSSVVTENEYKAFLTTYLVDPSLIRTAMRLSDITPVMIYGPQAPSADVNAVIDSSTPEEAVAFLIKTKPKTYYWKQAAWLAERYEAVRVKSPQKVSEIFASPSEGHRIVLSLMTRVSVQRDQLRRGDMKAGRIAASEFLAGILSTQTVPLILSFVEAQLARLEDQHDIEVNNFAALLTHMARVQGLGAEDRTKLGRQVQHLIEINARITKDYEDRLKYTTPYNNEDYIESIALSLEKARLAEKALAQLAEDVESLK